MTKMYRDRQKCPATGKSFVAVRRKSSAGTHVLTKCPICRQTHYMLAGRGRIERITASPYDCSVNPTKDYPGE